MCAGPQIVGSVPRATRPTSGLLPRAFPRANERKHVQSVMGVAQISGIALHLEEQKSLTKK